MTGVIKTITRKGFGYITPDDSDDKLAELFFHANDLVDLRFDDLERGDAVVFEVVETEKGKNAVAVTAV